MSENSMNKPVTKGQLKTTAEKLKTYIDNNIPNVSSINENVNKKYEKPSSGIPLSDLSEEVKTLINNSSSQTTYTETDPTVPSWAKATTKPTYTAQEVGALPSSTVIPTKTSELTNDSNFLTEHQSLSSYYTKTEIDTLVGNLETLLGEI